jgi:hypothetical protein
MVLTRNIQTAIALNGNYLQLWGMMHSLDFANLSELLWIEAPTRSRPHARPEKQPTAIAQTVCEEKKAMTKLIYTV